MVIRRLQYLLTILSFSLLVGCQATDMSGPPVVNSNPLVNDLEIISAPKQKVPIAVYKFDDITGQR